MIESIRLNLPNVFKISDFIFSSVFFSEYIFTKFFITFLKYSLYSFSSNIIGKYSQKEGRHSIIDVFTNTFSTGKVAFKKPKNILYFSLKNSLILSFFFTVKDFITNTKP